MNVARLGNKYLADQEPWKVIKQDELRVQSIMYVSLQIAASLAVLSEPFLPFTTTKLRSILDFDKLSSQPNWDQVKDHTELIPSGHTIGTSTLLFSKIEDEQIQKQLDKLEATKKLNEEENKPSNTVVEAQKPTIEFDDFTKLDIRTGTILEAEKMPKADKLLILKVDTGIDVRTIVSGIAKDFNAEDIVGKQVTVLANLAPRKLRGVLSEGMILMTQNVDGKIVFINPDEDLVNNGTAIS